MKKEIEKEIKKQRQEFLKVAPDFVVHMIYGRESLERQFRERALGIVSKEKTKS